ncbi:MAG: chemotaxis-specific protein-glutamate methyltransferase CheB [Polyangia bacterium]
MAQRRIRVLVVDDSAFTRKVIRDLLIGSGQVDVVGIARDGLEALEKVEELKPDVVTLDLMMPVLDGVGFLRALPEKGAPRVIAVSSLDLTSDKAVEALASGAVEIVHKPTALATDRLYELSDELVRAVLLHGAAALAPSAAWPAPSPAPPGSSRPRARRRCELVLIGTSTGGPQALIRLLGALPADFPVPIGVVLHIPVGYTAAFAARLNESCGLAVLEAEEGMELVPGRAVLARAGHHLKVVNRSGKLVSALDYAPTHRLHRPAVDELFLSGAAAVGAGVLGVVLTGMGSDGLEGAQAIAAAGGSLLGEAQQSCIVYGMSRCVIEAGIGAVPVLLDQMAEAIMNHV